MQGTIAGKGIFLNDPHCCSEGQPQTPSPWHGTYIRTVPGMEGKKKQKASVKLKATFNTCYINKGFDVQSIYLYIYLCIYIYICVCVWCVHFLPLCILGFLDILHITEGFHKQTLQWRLDAAAETTHGSYGFCWQILGVSCRLSRNSGSQRFASASLFFPAIGAMPGQVPDTWLKERERRQKKMATAQH